MNLTDAEKAASKERLDELWRNHREMQAILEQNAEREVWTWIAFVMFWIGIAVGSRMGKE